MEGKLDPEDEASSSSSWAPTASRSGRGSGKDLSYRDDLTNERFMPHVIEPSAGADRGTLAFLCEAYHEDQAPDEKGEMQTRVVMKFHPRIAPIKAAVFPLVKKDGMPEVAQEIYRALKEADERRSTTRRGPSAAAIAARTKPARRTASPSTARRCRTAPSRSATATRCKQWRVKVDDVVSEIQQRLA